MARPGELSPVRRQTISSTRGDAPAFPQSNATDVRQVFKILFTLIALFVLVGVMSALFGIFAVEDIRAWLDKAEAVSPLTIALLIVLLLSIDLLLAIPTLTVTLLAGYYLGIGPGSLTAYAGMTICALIGYGLGRLQGDLLLEKLLRDAQKRRDLKASFLRDGPVMILLSRSAPMLPEACACLAGGTGMRFGTFLVLHTASTVPYVLLATYLGSRMGGEDPAPAISAAIAVYAILWVVWLWRRKAGKRGVRADRQGG